jgi:hypothetical protein
VGFFSRRRQWFEIQDFPWCPNVIRDGVTDYLQFVLSYLNIYTPILPLLLQGMKQSGEERIVDLCSGGGGPVPKLVGDLKKTQSCSARVVLTDKYPNLKKFEMFKLKSEGLVDFRSDSIDATAVPEELKGMRTSFSSFHHFSDEMARLIVKDAFDKRAPIGIFEFTPRNFKTLLMTAPTPFFMWLLTPMVRPFRLSRLLFTYLIPLIPLVATFDVLVSVMRTRNEDELTALTSEFVSQDYEWRVGRVESVFGMEIVYLTGNPK